MGTRKKLNFQENKSMSKIHDFGLILHELGLLVNK